MGNELSRIFLHIKALRELIAKRMLCFYISDLVVGKEMDDDADDEVRVTYAGVDSVLGIPVQKDQAQVFNVLLQQATYELKKGQPLVSLFKITSIIISKYLIILYFGLS